MYKDVAKWLMGFLPVTTLASVGVALAPSAGQIAQVGLWDWIGDRTVAAIAVLAVLAATVAMVATCAYVLLAEPTAWNELTRDTKWMTRAFSTYSIGRPYFLDARAFDEADLKCQTDTQHPLGAAVADVTARVVALSGDLNAKARLKAFLWLFAVGAVVVVGGVLTVLVSSSGAAAVITGPTPVALHVPAGAEADFVRDTGCSTSAGTVAVAVGGTLDHPDLRLFGAGCTNDQWTPPRDLPVLVTHSWTTSSGPSPSGR